MYLWRTCGARSSIWPRGGIRRPGRTHREPQRPAMFAASSHDRGASCSALPVVEQQVLAGTDAEESPEGGRLRRMTFGGGPHWIGRRHARCGRVPCALGGRARLAVRPRVVRACPAPVGPPLPESAVRGDSDPCLARLPHGWGDVDRRFRPKPAQDSSKPKLVRNHPGFGQHRSTLGRSHDYFLVNSLDTALTFVNTRTCWSRRPEFGRGLTEIGWAPPGCGRNRSRLGRTLPDVVQVGRIRPDLRIQAWPEPGRPWPKPPQFRPNPAQMVEHTSCAVVLGKRRARSQG